jgi:Ribonuclease G/E
VTARRAYLDSSPGERRGVIAVDGRPERLLIERDGAAEGPRLGACYRARVREVSGDRRLAFLDLGGGQGGVLQLGKAAPGPLGSALEVEVSAEAHDDKAAVLRALGPATGAPGLLRAAPDLGARLAALAPEAAIETGETARVLADEAEETALADRHALADGLTLWIEPTRAMVAVDVDWSGQGGVAGGRAAAANRRAVREAARLLRLKGLAGAIVIDLLGFPGGDEAIRAEARQAFAPDGPGVQVLPVSRLGLLQVAKPRRERPVLEVLRGPDGAPNARTVAQGLARALEREGRADPGARLLALCAPEVEAELRPLLGRLGPRFDVAAQLGWPRARTDIRTR